MTICSFFNPVEASGTSFFAFASSTCEDQIATGTVIHTFTSGEAVADFFLFAIFVALCIELFFKINRRVKTWGPKR